MKSTDTSQYKFFIGEIVRARKELGISQADLANRLGKPQSYIAKIELCERRIDIAELAEIGVHLRFEVALKKIE